MNKLTLDEQFLTLQQAKELQDLGIDFDYFNFCYYEDGIAKGKFTLTDFIATEDNVIPTLSVAEMMEILPDSTRITHYDGDSIITLYYCNGAEHYICELLLRDALFRALKWLKQNKLI